MRRLQKVSNFWAWGFFKAHKGIIIYIPTIYLDYIFGATNAYDSFRI